MDEELRAYLEATEARLMGRINGLEERMIERFRAVDATLAVTTEAVRAINGTLVTMTALLNMLVTGYGDHAKRITDLENKP